MRTSFIVTMKAFGDFVIAAYALREVRKLPADCGALKLLAGEHVEHLAAALQLNERVQLLRTGPDFPGAFDVGGVGVVRACTSLWQLRRHFARLPRGSELIFAHWVPWGVRERFLGSGYRHSGYLSAPNIYQAAAATLRAAGYQLQEQPPEARRERGSGSSGIATLFPASRVARKTIPPDVMDRVIGYLVRTGLRPEVIALAGEQAELPAGVPVRHIERNFGAVMSAISGSTLVVSADSLPAHLAEYLGVPTYVLSPVPNEYWLPLSAFRTRGWSLFSDSAAMPAWLDSRLARRGR